MKLADPLQEQAEPKARKYSSNGDSKSQEQSKLMHRVSKSIIPNSNECSLLYSDEEITVKKCDSTQLHGNNIKVKVTK